MSVIGPLQRLLCTDVCIWMCEGVGVCAGRVYVHTVRVCTVGHISNFEEHYVSVWITVWMQCKTLSQLHTLLLHILYLIYLCQKEHINAWSSLPFLSSDTVLSTSKFVNLTASTTLQHPSNISSVRVVCLETRDCILSLFFDCFTDVLWLWGHCLWMCVVYFYVVGIFI